MRDKNEIICHCQEVTYGDIVEAIQNGAKTVEEIGDKTEAGITCGGCIEDLEEILEEELK
ncbi:(2Fe-2S)-binding protein [Candidatus Izimaplasma bacterium ZiA1]|uniref:(2Fe-2S)-binding protein n=1 Tax=Candidatus Izimoplasma sp. ZiA1 TaxID=2024899 RepID=UPI000BAA8C47|nr:(2Fe-2S)-binding protein [Candidatus Izimaplasma bacterium ZiA1]